MSAGFSFAEVQDFTISQLKTFSVALSQKQAYDALNSMNYARVAYHADGKEYDRIVKDLKRK